MANKGLPIVLIFVFVVGFCLFGYGLLLVLGSTSSQGNSGWFTFGLGFLVAGGGIAGWSVTAYIKQQKAATIAQPGNGAHLPGDVKISQMKCASCGGAIDSSAVRIENHVPMVFCPYCGASYQVSEEPKW